MARLVVAHDVLVLRLRERAYLAQDLAVALLEAAHADVEPHLARDRDAVAHKDWTPYPLTSNCHMQVDETSTSREMEREEETRGGERPLMKRAEQEEETREAYTAAGVLSTMNRAEQEKETRAACIRWQLRRECVVRIASSLGSRREERPRNTHELWSPRAVATRGTTDREKRASPSSRRRRCAGTIAASSTRRQPAAPTVRPTFLTA